MIKAIAVALALAAASAAAEEAQDRWNLADLYPSVKAWHEDAATLRTELKTIAACRGHLGESAARLKSCLERYAEAPGADSGGIYMLQNAIDVKLRS